jgi:hypothetical protein
MPKSRRSPQRPPQGSVKPCDGTVQDYRRHSHRGEEPCPESREAWRRAKRHYRATGIWTDRDPERAHPFMFRTPKERKRDRGGSYVDPKSRSKNKGRS